MILQWSIDY